MVPCFWLFKYFVLGEFDFLEAGGMWGGFDKKKSEPHIFIPPLSPKISKYLDPQNKKSLNIWTP